MTPPTRSIIDARRDQMLPMLEPNEIQRVSRLAKSALISRVKRSSLPGI